VDNATGKQPVKLIPPAGLNLTGRASDTAFFYKPYLKLFVYNLNASATAVATAAIRLPVIFDPTSVALVASFGGGSGAIGTLMTSLDPRAIDPATATTAATWAPAALLDHSIALTASNADLQILNGAFVTPVSTGAGAKAYISYGDITNVVAGSGVGPATTWAAGTLDGTSYRWATFRWSVTTVLSKLWFRLKGFTGAARPLKLASPGTGNPSLSNGVRVYYCLQDGGLPPAGQDITAGVCYSTVWINAALAGDNISGKVTTRTYNPSLAAQNGLGGLNSAGDVAGGAAAGDDIILGGANGVYCPTIGTPRTVAGVSVFLAVGLPMANNVAFTGVIMTCSAS
jgi:hypothetical protein